jgi:hypothetical protein
MMVALFGTKFWRGIGVGKMGCSDAYEQVAFCSFSIAGRTYLLVRHNLADIQDIREEANLIFQMEDGEGVSLLDQAA